MKNTIINTITDNKIGTDYKLVSFNAKDLSMYLKEQYKNNGIILSDYYGVAKKVDVVPIEIYEYQNFFLLEKDNSYILLDGFRRLLLYDVPDTNILVRVYDSDKLDHRTILRLLVDLNHFKFHATYNRYYERGFSLFLKSMYDLDVNRYQSTFNGYLSGVKTKMEYSNSEKDNIDNINDRIINDYFVSDIKFIQDVYDAGYMTNNFFGALVQKIRQSNTKHNMDSVKFIEYVSNNTIFLDLMVKYNKCGTSDGAKSRDVVNQIIEMYENAFKYMFGYDVEKSYAEKISECKTILTKLKKDKTLIKLTGNSNDHLVTKELIRRHNNKENIEFVFIVYPSRETNESHGMHEYREFVYGVYTRAIKFMRKKENIWNIQYFWGFTEDGMDIEFQHNYKGKKYTKLEVIIGNIKYHNRIEVFARLPKDILTK